MERISIDNYENLFLAYYQNELSPEEIHDLYSFLLHHPELGEVFEEMENANPFKLKTGIPEKPLHESEHKHTSIDVPDHLLLLPVFLMN